MGLSLIQNNPYRVLGIPILSSERELQKQITKSNRFAEVGKTVTCDTDYPFIGKLERTLDSINLAAKSIEQPLNKVLYSTFWFLNGNHIDNLAMASLQKDDFDKAKLIYLWVAEHIDYDVVGYRMSRLPDGSPEVSAIVIGKSV